MLSLIDLQNAPKVKVDPKTIGRRVTKSLALVALRNIQSKTQKHPRIISVLVLAKVKGVTRQGRTNVLESLKECPRAVNDERLMAVPRRGRRIAFRYAIDIP